MNLCGFCFCDWDLVVLVEGRFGVLFEGGLYVWLLYCMFDCYIVCLTVILFISMEFWGFNGNFPDPGGNSVIAVCCFGFFLVQEVFPIIIYVIVLCAVNVRCYDFVLFFVCKLTVYEKRKES